MSTPSTSESYTVFAFDIGTGSLGEAVQRDLAILHKESLLLPDDLGALGEQRSARRAYRTRLAHKAREHWLRDVCRGAGIEVLIGRNPGSRRDNTPATPGDERLEREFPRRGETTCYTSCLLRIKLLRGDTLEGWQVFKALHSAIQRRGFDPHVPWKHRARGATQDADDKESLDAQNDYLKELAQIVGDHDEWRYPCYLDAYEMGLWSPADPGTLKLRIDHRARRARGTKASPRTVPRTLIERELRDLLAAAARQFPALAGKAEYVLYGPTEIAYASYDPIMRQAHGIREGAATDWDGVLGQKIPRFDNRIVANCALIPHLHVCRADDGLNLEVTFLLKAMNMRIYRQVKGGQAEIGGLSVAEVNELYQLCKKKAADKVRELRDVGAGERDIDAPPINGDERSAAERRQNARAKAADQWKMTKSDYKRWLLKHGARPLDKNQELIEAPRLGGRSRFSRPALKILRDLVLSGQAPSAFRQTLEATMSFAADPKKGMTKGDLVFLDRMGETWSGLYIPALSLIEKYAGDDTVDREAAVRELIAEPRNPLIRHRLDLLNRRLDTLVKAKKFGVPDHVVLEFIREDFMGEIKRKELAKRQNENRKERDKNREELDEAMISGRGSLLKLQLLKQQGGQCLYTGEPLGIVDLDIYEVDHIVPREENGSDAMHNKVLTTHATNFEKAKRTPFEWLNSRGGWDAYLGRVTACATNLGPRKTAMLTSPEARDLDVKYTSLAETAWIARLARDLICLKFGWQPGEKGEKRRVTVINGALTAKVRRMLRIDSLLAPGETDADAIVKKNRKDKRHHALDAMVLSYIPEWARNPRLAENFTLPNGIHREFFREHIEQVVPRYVATEPASLEQTIYAQRDLPEDGLSAVKRIELADIPLEGLKKVYSRAKGLKKAETIVDEAVRETVKAALEQCETAEDWGALLHAGELRLGIDGPVIKRVAVRVGALDEYKDLSDDGDETVRHLRRDAKHKGYFVYLDAKSRPKVRPVYAYDSVYKVRQELILDRVKIIDYFWSNCRIAIDKDIDLGNRVIPAGEYLCSTIKANGQVILEGGQDYLNNPIGLANLLAAGFRRVSEPASGKDNPA